MVNGNTTLRQNVPQESIKIKKETSKLEKDPKALVKASYECVQKILELDTQNTVCELNGMETINNGALLKYRDVVSYCSTLKKDSDAIKEIDRQLKDKEPLLENIEQKIEKLYNLVSQLDEWSSELELKSRKYKK